MITYQKFKFTQIFLISTFFNTLFSLERDFLSIPINFTNFVSLLFIHARQWLRTLKIHP